MDNNEFLTPDCHLDLDAAYGEIRWIYEKYGIERDENLNNDERELKQKILKFVDDVDLLPRCMSAIWRNGKCKGYYRISYPDEPAEICRNCEYFDIEL
ncbi:MAG: hypothetical protein GX299_08555 [Epulopiscium sp.]|nr:hypothetical protein [Candidatus Epulonipiscium sp.]